MTAKRYFYSVYTEIVENNHSYSGFKLGPDSRELLLEKLGRSDSQIHCREKL